MGGVWENLYPCLVCPPRPPCPPSRPPCLPSNSQSPITDPLSPNNSAQFAKFVLLHDRLQKD